MENIAEEFLFLKNKLSRDLSRAKKKLQKQNIELEEAKNWGIYKKFGDLILANKNFVKKGERTIELNDFETAELVKIDLNTTLSAVENAEIYYKKARKGKRGFDICVEKIKETNYEIENLQGLLEKTIDFVENGFLRREFEAEIFLTDNLQNLDKQSENNNSKNKKSLVPSGFRHYKYKGYDIYAGKTSSDNDELSVKFANPSDIWFHAVGYAGSHLIIRRKKNDPMPPNEILSIAGGIAVFFSKAKHCGVTEVHFTEARFVRKPRKSPPGLVTVERYKTLRVSPIDPQKLFKDGLNEN